MSWGMFASSVLLDGWLIYLTFDDKSDAELERSTRNLRTQLESIQQVKFAELESRVIVLEAKIRQLDFEVNRPTRRPDDSASNVKSMSREEYQSWALKNASGRNRQILADHFKKENEFKVSLKPTQKKEFDSDVDKAYKKC